MPAHAQPASNRVPYQHVPKKHAKYLLAKLEEHRAENTRLLGEQSPYIDIATLAAVVGLLQHYAGAK